MDKNNLAALALLDEDDQNAEEFQETLTSTGRLEDAVENLEETMTFQDIYASLLLHDEIRITIPTDELDRVKVGMKNVKGKIATKNRESGLPVDSSVLKFSSIPSDLADHIVLTIIADRKGSVVVKKIEVPTDDL